MRANQFTFDNEFNFSLNKKKNIKSIISNILIILLSIIVIFTLIFSLTFSFYEVIGVSMKPTYNPNLEISLDENDYLNSIYKDKVLVNKLDKGSNGDIIVLNRGKEDVIKRLIASEGQEVVLRQQGEYCFYYVNGVKLDESYLEDNYLQMDSSYFEELRSNNNLTTEFYNGYEQLRFTVPQNHIFVLGDNRAHSEDSHIYGTISRDSVVGKVIFSYSYNQTFFQALFEYIF